MGIFDKFTGGGNDGGGTSTQDQMPMPTSAPPTVATAETNVRLAFLRKVYTLLTINFAITVGISLAMTYIRGIQDWVIDNWWITYVGLGAAFVFLLVLSCVRLGFPINLVVLFAFVGSFSVCIGSIVSRYEKAGAGLIVLQAFAATAAVFLTITAYIAVTKKDFSFLYGFLSAALIVLIVVSLLNFAFSLFGRTNRWVSFAISVFGALLMTGYLLYDTSQVITRFGPDMWLPAVIALYVDVMNLFLFFLNIFSFASN